MLLQGESTGLGKCLPWWSGIRCCVLLSLFPFSFFPSYMIKLLSHLLPLAKRKYRQKTEFCFPWVSEQDAVAGILLVIPFNLNPTLVAICDWHKDNTNNIKQLASWQ